VETITPGPAPGLGGYRRSAGSPRGHYEPFLDGHEPAVEAELAFLRQHVLAGAARPRRPELEHRPTP
jgi:hypothetical protein